MLQFRMTCTAKFQKSVIMPKTVFIKPIKKCFRHNYKSENLSVIGILFSNTEFSAMSEIGLGRVIQFPDICNKQIGIC